MVIRRHTLWLAGHHISTAVVADINHNVDIFTTNGFIQNTLCLTGTETWTIGTDQVSISFITVEDNVVFVYIVSVSSPFYEIMINLFTKACTTFVSNDSETAHGYGF